MKLSVIVITKNEEHSIRDCLGSIVWADEIIVVDSGSIDNTVAISREYTDKVFVTDWPGFGEQKNRALEMATCDWVLSLDADERVTPKLQAEIQKAIAYPNNNVAFKMPRLSNYCGRYMRHSGWWPDYIIRLFQRGKAHFTNDLVHEHLVVNGDIEKLSNPLLHNSFDNLEDVLDKVNSYSSAGARMMHQKQKKATLVSAIFHGMWAFVHTYILRAGFLDGREGLMLAISNAEGTYYRYLKLMMITRVK